MARPFKGVGSVGLINTAGTTDRYVPVRLPDFSYVLMDTKGK